MSYGKLLMEKPGGQQQKKIPLGFSWLMLFFGPLVPLFRGQALHFFLSVALLIPTMSVSWWTSRSSSTFSGGGSISVRGICRLMLKGRPTTKSFAGRESTSMSRQRSSMIVTVCSDAGSCFGHSGSSNAHPRNCHVSRPSTRPGAKG